MIQANRRSARPETHSYPIPDQHSSRLRCVTLFAAGSKEELLQSPAHDPAREKQQGEAVRHVNAKVAVLARATTAVRLRSQEPNNCHENAWSVWGSRPFRGLLLHVRSHTQPHGKYRWCAKSLEVPQGGPRHNCVPESSCPSRKCCAILGSRHAAAISSKRP